MANDIVDTSVHIEWVEDGSYWECPLIGQRWAKFAGLVARTDDGLAKVDESLYQVEKHHSGEFRIRWMGEATPRPERAYAQVIAKPKPPGTFLSVPMPIVTPIVAALATAAAALLVQYVSEQDGSLSPDEAKFLENKLTRTEELLGRERERLTELRVQLGASEANLSNEKAEVKNLLAKLTVYADQEEELHRLFIDDPETAKLSYVLGISHAYRIEVIKRLSDDDPQLKSMLTGIEEDYVRDTFADVNQSEAFTKGKAFGQEEAAKVFGLGETPVLGGQDVLRSLEGGN